MSFLILLAACGASQPPGPYYGDERYLVLGVRPDAEAAALVEQLAASGYPVAQQLTGQNFMALGFMDEQGLPAKVRIVTARGTQLALDSEPQDALHEGVRYQLLDAPLQDTHDADGDGFEEVFVELRPESGAVPCILVYRVRDSGFVDPVPGKDYTLLRAPDAAAGPWLAPEFCDSDQEPAAADATFSPSPSDSSLAPPAAADAGITAAPAPSPAAPSSTSTDQKPSASPATR